MAEEYQERSRDREIMSRTQFTEKKLHQPKAGFSCKAGFS